jgi:hypothetical protein
MSDRVQSFLAPFLVSISCCLPAPLHSAAKDALYSKYDHISILLKSLRLPIVFRKIPSPYGLKNPKWYIPWGLSLNVHCCPNFPLTLIKKYTCSHPYMDTNTHAQAVSSFRCG